MTAFIQGTKNVGISGGNFRQSSHHEQHDHHTRVFREDRTIIQGNIYGYTHTATSDDGPIIAYSHNTNFTRPHCDEISDRRFRTLPRDDSHSRRPSFNESRRLGDDTSLESQRNFSQAQHQLSDSLSLGDKNLEAEFRTMSPEMQNYVIYMLGLVKENATSGSMVETLNDAEPIPRGLTASPSELKSPINVDSESGAHESYQTDDTVESNRIKPSLHISSHIAGHVETQSLPEPKPSTMNRANQRESQERLRVNQSRKVPTVTARNDSSETKEVAMKWFGKLVRKARGLWKTLDHSAKP